MIQERSLTEKKCMAIVHWLHRHNNPVVKVVNQMGSDVRINTEETDVVNLLFQVLQTYTPTLGERITQELACEVSDSPCPQEKVSAPVKYSLGMSAKDTGSTKSANNVKPAAV